MWLSNYTNSGSNKSSQVHVAELDCDDRLVDQRDRHRYRAFKSFPDGSVAYSAQGTSSPSVKIARVLTLLRRARRVELIAYG